MFLITLVGFLMAQSSGLSEAQYALEKGEFSKSIALVEDYTAVHGLSRDDPNTLKAYLIMARDYKNLKQPFFSFEYYLLARYSTSSTSNTKSTVAEETGDLICGWGYFSKGISYYQRALSTCRKSEENRIRNKIAKSFVGENRLDSSCTYYRLVIDNSGSQSMVNEAKIGVANNLMSLKKYDDAMNWILGFYKNIDIPSQKILLHNYLGHLYQQKKHYDKAISSFESALTLAKQIGDEKERGDILQRIGFLKNKQGDYEEALSLFLQSLEILKSNQPRGNLLATYNYISKLYLVEDKLRIATRYADSVLILSTKHPNSLTTFRANELLKTIYEQKGAMKKMNFHKDEMERIDQWLNNKETIKKQQEKKWRKEIDAFETQYTTLIKNSYLQNLEYKNLKLATLAQKNKLGLMIKNRAINQQKLLLSNKKLNLEQKARDIEKLTADKKIQQLLIEKQKSHEEEELRKISSLEKDVNLNELELRYKDQKIQSQQYLQHLFILGFVIFVLLAILVYFKFRYNQKIQKEAMEGHRKDTENKLFRSQMNPHFLFNSLNSIKSFILTNESKLAGSYLSKFSLLMRHILDNSDNSFIPLWKEIETLSLYLDLEKMRFDDCFDYQIIIDDELEPENTYLPPMLLQPHVENAILHGFRGKKSLGLIKIEVKEQGSLLLCSIEDNGVGRLKSKRFSRVQPTHESKAIHLVEKHLENINSTEKMDVNMKIIDLVNDKGVATGTRVEIVLPFKMENPINYHQYVS